MALLQILIIVLQLFSFILFLRVMLTWLPFEPIVKIIQILAEITDPLLAPIQKIIPPIAGLDFTPIILFFILSELTSYLSSFLL